MLKKHIVARAAVVSVVEWGEKQEEEGMMMIWSV
jgi:hypothetical protein